LLSWFTGKFAGHQGSRESETHKKTTYKSKSPGDQKKNMADQELIIDGGHTNGSARVSPSLLCTWQENGWMSGSCFRSSPHHGRRANGALVMMVLSKGIDRVNLDAWFRIASSVVRFGGRLAMF
jgi:hypothetical protein